MCFLWIKKAVKSESVSASFYSEIGFKVPLIISQIESRPLHCSVIKLSSLKLKVFSFHCLMQKYNIGKKTQGCLSITKSDMKMPSPKPSAWPFLYQGWQKGTEVLFFLSCVREKLLTTKCRLREWFKSAVVLYDAPRLLDNKNLSLYLYLRNKETTYSERRAWKLEGR